MRTPLPIHNDYYTGNPIFGLMQLPLGEIWDFMELHDHEESHWQYELCAGAFHSPALTARDIHLLAEENHYDQELLPSIFTYREILWQPNVYDRPNLCLPGLKLLEAYCKEYVDQNKDQGLSQKLYSALVEYLGGLASTTVIKLEKDDNTSLAKILGGFRSKAFPIIQFFIWHPRNKPEHVADAQKRLNYTVKILLTQYYKHYSELTDPYWKVTRVVTPDSESHRTEASAEEAPDHSKETESPTEINPSETT